MTQRARPSRGLRPDEAAELALEVAFGAVELALGAVGGALRLVAAMAGESVEPRRLTAEMDPRERRPRESEGRRDRERLPDRAVEATSGLRRRAELAGLGARTGASYAVNRARRLFAPPERKRELDAEFQFQTAAQVTERLGNMKGVLMKVGQMASYLSEGVPEAYRDALVELQQDAPPMSPELAAGVIKRELGRAPDAVFAEWEPEAMAAASIGQVHRAVTHDGRAVAVKVQYPGVDEAIRSDLSNAGMLFSVLRTMFPGMEPGPLVEEIKARLSEELDYGLEAANQRLFTDYYAEHPFIAIPAVVDELCTDRVLTTELAVGARFDELERWSQEERNLASETIFRFVYGGLYRLHAFNGDPHPGNYLFQPGGRVTFLDFGLVKRFTSDEVQLLEDMVRAIAVDHDAARFRSVIETARFLKPGQSFSDELVEQYFGHFFQFLRDDQTMTFDGRYAAKTVGRLTDTSGPYGDIMRAGNAPPFAVILQRINLGLFAILGRLEATANWRRIAEETWPFVNGPPATALGREEAEWRARTRR